MIAKGKNERKVTATSLTRGKERILSALLKRKDVSTTDKLKLEIKLALTTDKYKF
jgi:hypothetical protein